MRPERAGFTTGVNTPQIFPTSQLLTQLTGEAVQANKAIVGRNAFAHEAGIHQDGMLKDRRTYEIMNAEDVGVPKSTLVLGKHSGRHAVQKRCEELGLALSKFELDRVYRQMTALADRQKNVSDQELPRSSRWCDGRKARRHGHRGAHRPRSAPGRSRLRPRRVGRLGGSAAQRRRVRF